MVLKDITEENLKRLEECRDEKVTLFVSGGGGLISVLQQMLYIINSEPDRFTIVTADYNGSCNFFLLLLAKCKVVILSEATAGYHHPFQQREINSIGKPRDYYENFMLEDLSKFRNKELRMIKELELTKEQIERVDRGAFVYFHSDRIKELLKKDWSWFLNDSEESKADVNTYKVGDKVTTNARSITSEGKPYFLTGEIVFIKDNEIAEIKSSYDNQSYTILVEDIIGYCNSTSVSSTGGANTSVTYSKGDNITYT